MNTQTHPSSTGDVVMGAAEALAGVAIGTAVLFPLAIPCLILTLAALVLVVLPVAVLAVVAAVPVFALRGVFTRCHDRAGYPVPEV